MQEKTKQWLNDFFILNAGTLLTAVGSYFFKFPNNFRPAASPAFRL